MSTGQSPTSRTRLLDFLAQVAPGTPLRDGLERIVRGRTGALVVLGHPHSVEEISTGGFQLNVPFSPTALRELAKMDGALILDASLQRIVGAGIQLMPDPSVPTVETGTRHRTAERVARQTGVPVVSVSASMSTIQLYVAEERHLIEHSEQLLSRAHQALQTFERYKARLLQASNRLSVLEVEDQVTVRDVARVAQLLEMAHRLHLELTGYVVELGSDGRLLNLQLHELSAGLDELRTLLEKDYRPAEESRTFALAGLHKLSTAELLDLTAVARAAGFGPQQQLDTPLVSRGYRQVAQISRLPGTLGVRLIEHFGSLQALFGASVSDLQAVDGVGEHRARIIRDGLLRLAESAYSARME
jgi:diadenylate cyclase